MSRVFGLSNWNVWTYHRNLSLEGSKKLMGRNSVMELLNLSCLLVIDECWTLGSCWYVIMYNLKNDNFYVIQPDTRPRNHQHKGSTSSYWLDPIPAVVRSSREPETPSVSWWVYHRECEPGLTELQKHKEAVAILWLGKRRQDIGINKIWRLGGTAPRVETCEEVVSFAWCFRGDWLPWGTPLLPGPAVPLRAVSIAIPVPSSLPVYLSLPGERT